MKSATYFAVLPALAAVVAVAGCGNSGGPRGQQPTGAASTPNTINVDADAKGIQTVTVQTTAVPEYLEVPARIDTDPTTVVHVFAPAGGRVVEVKVRPWQHVEKGQTLATLQSGDLARAVADYHKALVDNGVKQKEAARSQDLYDHHAISEREYQRAQADLQLSKAEVEAAREQVRALGMDPDHAAAQLILTAPREGVILGVAAAPGEFSQALAAPAPVCTIADIRTVWALGGLYEKDLAATKSGVPARVTLSAYPNRQWTGRVSAVGDAVDPATRTLQIRVLLENPDGSLKPGLFGTIRLLRSTAQGILLPAAAVIREGTEASVFVAKGNGQFERRSVQLGRTVDGNIEIISGVNPGENVVTDGALLLRSAGQG